MVFTRRRRRGGNAIEFALTLPVFVGLVFGSIEFGYFFSRTATANSVVGRACREAALIDASNPPAALASTCGGTGYGCVEMAGEGYLNAMSANAGINCTNCTALVIGASQSRKLECSMDVEYQDITGLFSTILPNSISNKTSVRLEWQRQ